MNFGQAQVELEAKCPINIGLKLSKISGEKQFCYDADKKASKKSNLPAPINRGFGI